jgi:cold-inducible RNA-binding protein
MSVRLFVGNLPYDATEAELRELFAPVGQLSYVTFPIDRESGRPRGFAFVDFGDRNQADEAIKKFNGTSFKGRTLAINEARARENRPPSPGGPPRSFSSPRPMSPRPSGGTGFPRRPEPQPMMGPLGEDGQRSRRNRSFGPDAKPKRARRDDRWAKAEGGKKGPIPVRGGGRLYGDLDDERYDPGSDEEEDLELFPKEEEEEDQAL